MAEIVQAKVKYPANKYFDGKYGDYANAVFESGDGEVRVYGNKGSKEAEALFNLQSGTSYDLIKEKKKNSDGFNYSLQDPDIESLLAEKQEQVAVKPQPDAGHFQEDAYRHAKVVANTYQRMCALIESFRGSGKLPDEYQPSTSDIQRMAVSAVIQASRDQ